MFIYFCLFIYYIVQLSTYQSTIKHGDNSDSSASQGYITATDSLLLVTSISALISGWMFRHFFDRYYVVYNSVLFGLTFGWLILTAPEISFHKGYYGCNIAVCLMLILVDVWAQLYVRPEVIAVNKPRKGSFWRGRTTTTATRYGKLKSRNNSIDEVEALAAMKIAAGTAVGGHLTSISTANNTPFRNSGTIISDEERNSITSTQSNDQMSQNSSIAGDEFYPGSDTSATGRLHLPSFLDPAQEILYMGKVDLTEKGLCDGFRVNMTNLPNNNPSIPHNLTWETFHSVHHLIDSSSCHIYTALWDDTPVVLKLIKAERITSPVAVAEFEIEENVLSRIRHPNVIRLLGSGTSPRKFLVLELLSGGSLSHSLGLRADTNNQVWVKRFSFLETLRLAYDLSKALHYLHSEWSNSIHIIHRDIKPDNIGWSNEGALKIFDFGLCVAVRGQRERTEQYRLTGNTGTLRYMAPEVVLGRSYNQSVDAYSFGILIWQVATGKVPFRDMGKKPYFDRVVVGGQRPKLDPAWPTAFANLLKACWHEDKNLRPSFQKISNDLDLMIRKEEEAIQIEENRLTNRIWRLMVQLCLFSRPLILFLVLGVFILSLVIIIAQNDTISGAVLGMVSSFVIYAVLMSYLKIWPSNMVLRPKRLRTNSLDVIEHMKRQNSIGGPKDIENGGFINAVTKPTQINLSSVVSNGESNAKNRKHASNNTSAPSTMASSAMDIELDDIELQSAKPLTTIIETNYSFNPLNANTNRSSKRNGSITQL